MPTLRHNAANRKEWPPHSPAPWSSVPRAVTPPGMAPLMCVATHVLRRRAASHASRAPALISRAFARITGSLVWMYSSASRKRFSAGSRLTSAGNAGAPAPS